MVILLLPLPFAIAFVRESPLLWAPLNIPVLTGYNTYRHRIGFNDPCSKIDMLVLLHSYDQQHRKSITEWCRLHLRRDFWTPLEQICQRKRSRILVRQAEQRATVNMSQLTDQDRQVMHKQWASLSGAKLSRQKRFPILAALAVVAIFTAVTAISFYIASDAWVRSRANTKKIAEAEHKLSILREQNIQHHDALKVLTMDLLNITQRIEKLQTEFDNFMLTLPQFSTTMAEVSTYLLEMKQMTRHLVQEWKQQHVSSDFFSFFNVTHLLAENSIITEAEPDECSFIEEEGLVTFSYYVPVSRPNAKILRAEPFVLYHNISIPNSNKTARCKFVYHGPSYALLVDDCVNVLEQSEVPSGKKAYGFSPAHTCMDAPANSTARYKAIDCGLEREVPWQMHFTPRKTYIYCATMSITIDKISLPCPDHTFSLPRSTEFTLGDFHYTVKSRVIDQLNVSIVDSLLVGSIVYPAAGIEDFGLADGLEHLLTKLQEPTPDADWSQDLTTGWPLVLGSCVATAIAVGLIAAYCNTKFKCQRRPELGHEQVLMQPLRPTVVRAIDSPDTN